ncbi:amidohydrolase family protein [Candidatus Poribacteria bacterium]|nr:amidohydrolase family protein [Candidatus Poribacteria bacterium]
MKITGRHYITEETVSIHIENDIIDSIETSNEKSDHWIAPALMDIQINGFGGYNFNGVEVSPEAVKEIVRLQWSYGIASICPTVTTNSHENIINSLKCINQACSDKQIANSIAGIHMEGPYISKEDGPRGAHPLEHVRDPDWDEFCKFQEAADGGICIFSLAPEKKGAVSFVEKLADSGVIPGIAHTNATGEEIDAIVKAGARLSTHLGNGSHALIPRHPNYIWEQLANDDLMASFISDGHHLPPSVVKCMFRCKELERTILVSDAVSYAGMPSGRYEGKTRSVEVSENGRVSLADTPYLAGAGLGLTSCVSNFSKFTDASLADAIHAASGNPARLLDRNTGSLEAGKQADLMLFKIENGEPEIQQTIVAGDIVYQL